MIDTTCDAPHNSDETEHEEPKRDAEIVQWLIEAEDAGDTQMVEFLLMVLNG